MSVNWFYIESTPIGMIEFDKMFTGIRIEFSSLLVFNSDERQINDLFTSERKLLSGEKKVN